MREYYCKCCGKMFIAHRRMLYCSDSCRKRKTIPEKFEDKNLQDLAMESKKLGISYGKYVSMNETPEKYKRKRSDIWDSI